MARFEFGAALGNYGMITDIVNPFALAVVEASTTVARLEDPEGDGFAFLGTGFTYSGMNPTGGTLNAVDVFTSTGDPLVTVTGLNASLAEIYSVFATFGVESAFLHIASGNDTFIGSQNGDYMVAGWGNDKLKGNGGADFLQGGRGRDVLTGGAGADAFIFYKAEGNDRITDFQDTGLATDDLISITRRMYSTMIATETLTGVELDFGNTTVVVDGWHLADVNRSDFLI